MEPREREEIRESIYKLGVHKEIIEKRVDGIENSLSEYMRNERESFAKLLEMIGDIRGEISKIKWLATGVAITMTVLVLYREEIGLFLSSLKEVA